MPYKSKAQMKKFFAMESRGELPKGTAKEWAHHTPNISKLPEKKRNPVESPTLTGVSNEFLKRFYDKAGGKG